MNKLATHSRCSVYAVYCDNGNEQIGIFQMGVKKRHHSIESVITLIKQTACATSIRFITRILSIDTHDDQSAPSQME
jgi:hypothetical protein